MVTIEIPEADWLVAKKCWQEIEGVAKETSTEAIAQLNKIIFSPQTETKSTATNAFSIETMNQLMNEIYDETKNESENNEDDQSYTSKYTTQEQQFISRPVSFC